MSLNTVIERISFFQEKFGINDNTITKKANLSIGLLGKSKKNKTSLRGSSIEKILHAYPQLNPTWLLTGRGNMLIQDKETENPTGSDYRESEAGSLKSETGEPDVEYISQEVKRLRQENKELKAQNEALLKAIKIQADRMITNTVQRKKKPKKKT